MRCTTHPSSPADPIHETPVSTSQIIPTIILPLYICPTPGTKRLSIPATKGSRIVENYLHKPFTLEEAISSKNFNSDQ